MAEGLGAGEAASFGDAITVGAGPADGFLGLACAGSARGAGVATGVAAAGLVDVNTVGSGPGEGLRRLAVLRSVRAGDAAAGLAATGLGEAITVGAEPVDGLRCLAGAVATGSDEGFAVIMTGAAACLRGVAGVDPATAVGLYPQICLRLRDTLGTQVTLPSMPARI